MRLLTLIFICIASFFQAQVFSRADTLKGSDTAFRNFWDVKKYEITVKVNHKEKHVSGSNKIIFEITKDITKPVFQIDLKAPMQYEIVESADKEHTSRREGDFIFIQSAKTYRKGDRASFTIEYAGNPMIAKNAPWDGGWVFSTDAKGNPHIGVAQEGPGASLWLPHKDSWSDEPDEGIVMKIITPEDLVGVGNGRLTGTFPVKDEQDMKMWVWEVKNPINSYSISPTIGKFVNFKDSFDGEKGNLDLDYWVLDYNLGKARKQFQQVKPMLSAMEYWFGPYPFYEDSFKIVETPYLGMEHQSNIAYGNKYMNGYLGRDLSGSGVGLNWDFIIVHESGHEWFANNITARDKADLWIHEGFTTYSEVLFTEKFMDKKSAEIYAKGIRINIQNDEPIIGKYGVGNSGSGDMYYKGANMIHTIRQVMNNDEKFRQILRGINRDFYHQTVTSQQIENYISEKSGIDFSTVFDQYLRTAKVPQFQYYKEGKILNYRFDNTVPGLKLPIRLLNGKTLYPNEDWQKTEIDPDSSVIFDSNYYVTYKQVFVSPPIRKSISKSTSRNLIIYYDKKIGKKHLEKAITEFGASVVYEYKALGGFAIRVPEEKSVQQAMVFFKKVKGVSSVHRDQIHHLH